MMKYLNIDLKPGSGVQVVQDNVIRLSNIHTYIYIIYIIMLICCQVREGTTSDTQWRYPRQGTQL